MTVHVSTYVTLTITRTLDFDLTPEQEKQYADATENRARVRLLREIGERIARAHWREAVDDGDALTEVYCSHFDLVIDGGETTR